MNDRTLDRLVAAAAPYDDLAEAGLISPEVEDTLLEAIMSTPRDTPTLDPGRRRRRLRVMAPVAAAAAAIAAVVGVQAIQQPAEPAWAAEILAVAEAAPRLLVEEDGWSVTRADEFSAKAGEMTFTGGSEELGLAWIPKAGHADRVVDRGRSSELRADGSVNGHPADIFRYRDSTEYVALWVQGDHSVQARGSFEDLARFQQLLASLRDVGVDTWLDALPDSVVRPSVKPEVIEAILADIPLPPGFSPGDVNPGTGVSERYHLGATVAGEVSCRWIEVWLDAVDRKDPDAAKRAVEAMGSSRSWAILEEMDADGDYSEVVWEFADAMAKPNPDPEDPRSVEGIRKTYRQAFCESA